MLRPILHYLRPPPLVDVPGLRRFLSGEASYLAQRSTYEFSRNTLAWFGQWAFGDDKFNDAFRFCRWEAFAAVLADMTVLAHDAVRGGDAAADTLVGRFVDLYESMMLEYPLPAHRPAGWADLVPSLSARLRAPARAEASEVARMAARRIYDVVPVRSANARADYEALEAAIRFGMVSFQDRLHRRICAGAIVPALLAAEIAIPRPSGATPASRAALPG